MECRLDPNSSTPKLLNSQTIPDPFPNDGPFLHASRQRWSGPEGQPISGKEQKRLRSAPTLFGTRSISIW